MARRVGQLVVVVLLVTQIAFPRPSLESNEVVINTMAAMVEPVATWTPKLLPPNNPEKLTDLEKAYLDVFTILKEDNPCSQFYGGPHAIAALNELISQLHPTYMDRSIALRMRGRTTLYQSNLTGFSYRMFDKAELNLAGPFYRGNGPSERRIPLVANFQPNTRESRLVVLLHELGHLVRNADAEWLLPDDGTDQDQSVKNTELVVGICRKEIESIGKVTPAQLLTRSSMETAQPQALVRASVPQL